MIKQLRKKFIRISVTAVASVMALLCIAVNTVYFLSVDARLNDMLEVIASNQGRIPEFKKERIEMRKDETDSSRMRRDFNEETPFSTRFFVLYYTTDGTLQRADLDRIAAVTQSDVQDYLAFALRRGTGSGYTSGYKYKITQSSDGCCTAIFLSDYTQIGAVQTVLVVSVLATVGCIALISIMIVLFSKKATEPIVENDRRQKQFITDAGHELKTPITVIRTSLRVLEMETGSHKWIDKAVAQTEKLTDLVNSLVSLSKWNEGETAFHAAPFSVTDALAETAESFADFAQQHGHMLDVRLAPDMRLCGDEYAVRQLASVLLDNAVKYASPQTPIRFSAERDKKGVHICLQNECDDVNADDLDKLFDRFYRADASRGGEKRGFGIGLSIARSICEAHRGSIRAESADGRSITFTAVLRDMPVKSDGLPDRKDAE